MPARAVVCTAEKLEGHHKVTHGGSRMEATGREGTQRKWR